jgi:hypothetical protein
VLKWRCLVVNEIRMVNVGLLRKFSVFPFPVLMHRRFVLRAMRRVSFLLLGGLLPGTGLTAEAPASHDMAGETGKKPVPIPTLPIPAQFPASTQLKLEAGHHWQSIAEDTALALSTLLRKRRCANDASTTQLDAQAKSCRSLYIAPPDVETGFSRAFTNALLTALVARGISVSQQPNAALVLHIDIQSLKFGQGEQRDVGAQVTRQLSPGLWIATTAPPAAKSRAQANRTPLVPPPAKNGHCEIFVTLSILDGPRYFARDSRLYYVSAQDLRLYEERICSSLSPCEEGQPGDPYRPPARKATLQVVDQ